MAGRSLRDCPGPDRLACLADTLDIVVFRLRAPQAVGQRLSFAIGGPVDKGPRSLPLPYYFPHGRLRNDQASTSSQQQHRTTAEGFSRRP